MVIEIKFNASNAIAGLRRMRTNMKTAVKEVLDQQGRSARRYARAIAPGRSGALKAGIAYQATDTRLKVLSGVPKAFPYNKWVNQDPGYVAIRSIYLPGGVRGGAKTVYGKTPSNWRWTGTPGYMTHTYWRRQKNFPLAMRRKLSTIFR